MGARIVDAGSKTTPRVSGRLMEVNLGERQVDAETSLTRLQAG